MLSGYSGHLPGAMHHFGTAATGMRSTAGQHESIHTSPQPMAQRDHARGPLTEAPPRLKPETKRLTSHATVGYKVGLHTLASPASSHLLLILNLYPST